MSTHRPVKIMGGAKMPEGDPTILDRTSKTEQPEVEMRVHEESVTLDDKLRREKPKEGEPEVRVRHDTGTFQASVNEDE